MPSPPPRALLPLLVAALITVPVVVAHADATPTISEIPTQMSEDSFPTGITAGPDGNLWVTEVDANQIARITPDGETTEFDSGMENGQPDRITTGPDGNLWYVDENFGTVARMTPDGVATAFRHGLQHDTWSQGIAAGPDGRLWFAQQTEDEHGYIGAITTAGVITEYSVPFGQPYRITAGPDGNLWFTETQGQIGRITTSGAVSLFTTPDPDLLLDSIAAGPDGNLWATGNGTVVPYPQMILRIEPDGTMTAFDGGQPPPTDSPEYQEPRGIAAGIDGNLWWVSRDGSETDADGDSAATATAVDGTPTRFTAHISPGVRADDIVSGPDGALWFTESDRTTLGRIEVPPAPTPTPTETPTETPTPTATASPTPTPTPPAGPAATASPAATATPAPSGSLALGCSRLPVVTVDVHASGRRVIVSGVTLAAYVGHKVRVSASAGGARATTTVHADRTFQVSLPAPPARRRATVRYTSTIDGHRSAALKLERKLTTISSHLSATSLRLTAQVRGGRRGGAVKIALQTTCDARKLVRTLHTDARGRFTITLPRPSEHGSVAFYRAIAAVGPAKTYTLPIAVSAR